MSQKKLIEFQHVLQRKKNMINVKILNKRSNMINGIYNF